MKCPACRGELMNQEIHSVGIDKCNCCGGLWLDRGELKKFVLYGDIPAPVFTSYAYEMPDSIVNEGERQCPRCGKILTTVQHKGINLDFCTGCRGFWFDKGEIGELVKRYCDESKQQAKSGGENRPMVRRFARGGMPDEKMKAEEEAKNSYAEHREEGLTYASEQKSGSAIDVEKELLDGLTMAELAKAVPQMISGKKKTAYTQAPFTGAGSAGYAAPAAYSQSETYVYTDVADAVDTGFFAFDILGFLFSFIGDSNS